MRTARTWAWVEGQRVVAFYTISAHQIVREALPSRLGRGSPQAIPAVLLGKLALDVSLRGKGLGGELLVDALGRVVLAAQQIAVRMVVVDAVDQGAVSFYEHFGFVKTAPDSFRLVRKVSDIERDLLGSI